MSPESLEKVQDKVAEIIDQTDIPIYEKVELLINLIHFLDSSKYEKNIKILKNNKK